MKETREYNFDILRVLCCAAVIITHVSQTWYAYYNNILSAGGDLSASALSVKLSVFYTSAFRFAVPCFVMLSGAFVLDHAGTGNYREFYRKSFAKIGIPTIIFSILYLLYSLPFAFVGDLSGWAGIREWLLSIVHGMPYFHMWYMYMLIGVYALAPWVWKFKEEIGERAFVKVSIIFTIMAVYSMWTTKGIAVQWHPGMAFCYLGYFSLGYVIRKHLKENAPKATLDFLLAAAFLLLAGWLLYDQTIVGRINLAALPYSIIGPMDPLITAGAIFLFMGFARINVKHAPVKAASASFLIYLMHGGVWHTIEVIPKFLWGQQIAEITDSTVWIPVMTVIVFMASWAGAVIYNKIVKRS